MLSSPWLFSIATFVSVSIVQKRNCRCPEIDRDGNFSSPAPCATTLLLCRSPSLDTCNIISVAFFRLKNENKLLPKDLFTNAVRKLAESGKLEFASDESAATVRRQ
jgi:hypothetical protein